MQNNNADIIDNFHIPHIKFSKFYLTCGSPEKSNQSKKDKSKRKFGVKFFLEDPIAKTDHVYLSLSEEILIRNADANIYFEKNNKNLLESIFIGLEGTGLIEVFNKASNTIFSILTILCFFYRRPAKFRLITITDTQYQIEFQTRDHAPKPEKLIAPLVSFINHPIGSLLAVYRDGINSADLPYKYICFFKIYEAWFKYSEQFFDRSKADFCELEITHEFLLGRYNKEFHEKFIGRKIGDEYVYEECNEVRKYLVHPMIHHKVPKPGCINLDSIEFSMMLESMVNLIEKISTVLLDCILLILGNDHKEIKKLLDIYHVCTSP